MRKLVFGLILAVLMIFSTTPTTFAASKNQLIIINKSTNKLAFFENGKLVKTFSVATGRQASYTPEGTFRIVNKIKNRPYYKGGIPGGDPRNPLGDRWLGLNARGTYGTTYAIHGNSNPSSIGKYVSSGCVRMYDDEVRWLFSQVELNTKVIIGQFKSQAFEMIANKHGYAAKSVSAPPVCKGICYEGKELSKGQIGFVTIKKTMPLLKKNESGKYEATSRTLQPGAVYKAYKVDKAAGVVDVGGGMVHHNLDRITVKYLPKEVVQKVEKYFGPKTPPVAPPVCKGICYEGKELSKGQIGFVTIKKSMPLLKKNESGKYEATSQTLQPGAVYKAYKVDKAAGVVDVGGGMVHHDLDRITVKYLPKEVVQKVEKYFGPKTPPVAPPVCKGICYEGKELSKGQIGFVTIKKSMPLFKKNESGKYEATSQTLQPGAVYKAYNVDKTIGMVDVGGGVVELNLDRIHIIYLPASVIEEANQYFFEMKR